jgi:hypothetical protein
MKRPIRAVTTGSGTEPELEHSIVESAYVEFRSERLLRLFAQASAADTAATTPLRGTMYHNLLRPAVAGLRRVESGL